jgi:hypothetical protein
LYSNNYEFVQVSLGLLSLILEFIKLIEYIN